MAPGAAPQEPSHAVTLARLPDPRCRAASALVNRRLVGGASGLALIAIVGGALAANALLGGPGPSPTPVGSGVASVPSPSASGSASTSPGESPTPSPTPTPVPTPVLVPAPLDGVLVSPALAKQHPIAVMIDDLSPARPQSGFSDASVVWQAPAEGGIPRYMMIFQERTPKDVGPVRSSRLYFIEWAAEWKAAYVHAGGSPQALSTLRAKGAGQWVYNIDQFRWGAYFRRIPTRFAPHNLYTTGKDLRQLAKRAGATASAHKAVWTFAPDAPLEARPVGGRIEADYQDNVIVYRYDRATNTYQRSVSVEGRQVDAGTKKKVAPKNVVIMRMVFGPLGDDTHHHRLEAQVTGSGVAWIATNGKTIKGTWRKKSATAPTLFYDKNGKQVTLTVGQTFVQVMKTTDRVVIKDGTVPPSTGSPSPSPSASPSAWSPLWAVPV